MRPMFQTLACGCMPDRGYACKEHRFLQDLERGFRLRMFRGLVEPAKYAEVRRRRMQHHREQAE